VTPEIVVREGSPAREIVEVAQAMDADFLIMGTHGRSGFERLRLGSVTEKVLRTVRCPVLTVPQLGEHSAPTPVLFKTILCRLDFSESSTRALARRRRRRRRGRMVVTCSAPEKQWRIFVGGDRTFGRLDARIIRLAGQLRRSYNAARPAGWRRRDTSWSADECCLQRF
jgi:hypothetical protein